MPDPTRAIRQGSALDLVNVVFQAELPLLTLQARSIAKHADSDALNSIVVIINDPDEAACRRAVERVRPEYGRFSERLRIVTPDQLLTPPQKRLSARLEAAWVAGGRTRLKRLLGTGSRRKNPKGWCGNNGWSMQQAFKLLSGRACTGTHIVFLDAKNHFLQAFGRDDFIDSDGRTRSRALSPDAKQRAWVDASFAAIGLEKPADMLVPPTVTPFAIERSMLLHSAERLESLLGPLECFFALRRGQATEFMLLYAEIDRGKGHWWTHFAEGLPESTTVFRPPDEGDPDDAILLAALRSLRDQPTLLAGIHRTRLDHLHGDARDALLSLWQSHGLIADADELQHFFPERVPS